MQRHEDLTRNYTYLEAPFTSELESTALAAYGELSTDLTTNLHLISGLRVENWANDYQDNDTICPVFVVAVFNV